MSRVASAQTSAVAKRPRLGFTGLGWIGTNRLRSIVEAGVAEVVAINDVESRSLDEAQLLSRDATVCSSFEELLEQDIEAVVIATPNKFHAQQAVAALKRGLAVFCQKPLGRTAFETRRVVEAARTADRLLEVDLSYQGIPVMRKINELVQSGALGKIFAVDAKFYNGYGPDKAWFFDYDLSGGGCVLDLGVHLIDLSMRALGYPKIDRVESSLFSGGKLITQDAELEDYGTSLIETVDGTVINLKCCWKLHVGANAEIELSFYGTEGGASLRNVEGSFTEFIGERFTRTIRQNLAVTSKWNHDWGGVAIVEWSNRVAQSPRFDRDAERFIEVAEVIDKIYGH